MSMCRAKEQGVLNTTAYPLPLTQDQLRACSFIPAVLTRST